MRPGQQPRQQPRQRLRGLSAAILLLLLIVGFPAVLIAIGAAPWDADPSDLRSLLGSRDDGTLALAVLAAVAWVAWATSAGSVFVEAVSYLRGIPAPSIPGLALPQRAARQLVAVAALLFVAAPTVVSGFPAPPAHAATTPPVLEAPRLEVVRSAPVQPTTPAPSVATIERKQATLDYTVKRGDSLWRIAEQYLGDGARYTEIVDLNRGVLHGRPDFIVSGTVLRVPHQPTPTDGDRDGERDGVGDGGDGRTTERYVVERGDTLSEIAEAKLGDSTRFPEIFAASQATTQPGGARLTDPDLVWPGWKLTIPGTPSNVDDPASPPDTGDTDEAPVDVGPPSETPVEEPTKAPPVDPTPTVDPRATIAQDPGSDHDSDHDSDHEIDHDSISAGEEHAPGWLMPGLAGGGAILAGAVLLAVRSHRRTQLRYRRPSQAVAAPPSELVSVEKSAHVTGAPLADSIQQLDRLLRTLAATVATERRPLPVLAEITLSRGTVTLHLGEPAELPPPWTGEGSAWATTLDDSLPDVDQIPPYPMLVTLGEDDAGRLHLVNLEHLRAVTLIGDRVAAASLARHLAAELALNPWSVLVDIDTCGVGSELVALDPRRLRHHAPDAGVVEQVVGALRRAERLGSGEPDAYRVILTTSHRDAAQLIDVLTSAHRRLGAATVALDTTAVPGTVAVELTDDGRVRVPAYGLDLAAAGLSSSEATACAAIVDLTRESPTVGVPPFAQVAEGWRALADQGGALLEELTEARPDGPAGAGSLLPQPTQKYIETAAAVEADIETLAPVVHEQVSRSVTAADPMLDDDLAAWFSDVCPLPRLVLLGSVTASAHGAIAPAIAKRKPYFVEMLAYLALHPGGRTGNGVADAFSIGSSRARTDLGHLRDWLGTNPRTGRLHLPLAADSRAYEQTGVKTYQVDDVLVDVDLFRRLRARGQARGAEGIADLVTALRLVDGLPFDHLRERGWSWLLDGDRLHETIGCAIVDTAHIVVLDALSKDDLATARTAAETACRAAPYDDISRLDLIKVAAAEGHQVAADQMLTDDIFNRSDDDLPPIDLPPRTKDVVAKQGWGSARRSKDH